MKYIANVTAQLKSAIKKIEDKYEECIEMGYEGLSPEQKEEIKIQTIISQIWADEFLRNM